MRRVGGSSGRVSQVEGTRWQAGRLEIEDVSARRPQRGVISEIVVRICTASIFNGAGVAGFLVNAGCVQDYGRRRYICPVDIAEINLDRVSCTALHGSIRIVE